MNDMKFVKLSEDELQHYGVKGMKWGVRRSPVTLAKAAGTRVKATAKMQKNSYVHPVASTKVALRTAKERPSSLLYNSTKNVKKINSDVTKEVAKGKAKKQNVKTAKKKYKDSVTEADKVFLKELAKAEKNPKVNDALTAALSKPSVIKTQAKATEARRAIKAAKGKKIKK